MYVTEPVSDSLTRDCPQCKAKAGVRGGEAPVKGARSAGCEVSRRSDVAAQSIIAGIKPHN